MDPGKWDTTVLSGHPKSIRIPQVEGLSTGPPDLGHHNILIHETSTINSLTPSLIRLYILTFYEYDSEYFSFFKIVHYYGHMFS